MCGRLNDVERETTLKALRHYVLQCEIWRDATSIARSADDPNLQAGATGMWALMIERLSICINKVSIPEVKPDASTFENQVVELLRNYRKAA